MPISTYLYWCFFVYFFSVCFRFHILCVWFQCRLIVAQMSSTRCEAIHWMTPIFVVSVLISMFIPFLERPLVYLLCILTTAAHWHYGTKVVSWCNSGLIKIQIANNNKLHISQEINNFLIVFFSLVILSCLGAADVCSLWQRVLQSDTTHKSSNERCQKQLNVRMILITLVVLFVLSHRVIEYQRYSNQPIQLKIWFQLESVVIIIVESNIRVDSYLKKEKHILGKWENLKKISHACNWNAS